MSLRIWIPCILLIVIFIIVLKAYFVEGFQSGGSGSYTRRSVNDTRIRFWSILNEDKAGSASGSKGSTKDLLSKVMNPGPNDTFKLVFPKYISMYALATYNDNPVAARKALLNEFDTMQNELKVNVDQEMDKRTAFAANPKAESCALLNKLTMSLYGKLLSIHASAEDISGNEHLAEAIHRENINIQKKSACMNQGASPSAECIALARLDETLFPLLPVYTNANISLLKSGQNIQTTIDLLLQAYMGIECLPVGGSASASGSGPLSISSVFSREYLNNLPIIDTDSFQEALQELSPYYVSTNIINFISGQLVGTAEFNSNLETTDEYIKDMAKTTNSIVSLTTILGDGQFFNEAGSGARSIQNCPPGYYCPPTATMPIQCPIGFYCPAGTTAEPIECPTARAFTALGASKEADCTTRAPLGYYLDSTLSKVLQCPAGYYCAPNASGVPVSTICPTGTYNMKKGMGNILACIDCPKGSYCPSSTLVIPCKVGEYSDTMKQTDKSACKPCIPGHYCPVKGVIQPLPCAEGTFSSSGGAGLSCTPVSPGYYLPGTGNLTDALKMPCDSGYYCPGGTGVPILCPPGSYCPSTRGSDGSRGSRGSYGGAGLTAPIKCPGGTYGSSGGATTAACSGACMAGYVCPPGSTSATVVDCPRGYYCPTGSAAGIPCPPGSYCPVGSADKQLCPPNTYNPLGQQTDIFACQPCPGGRVCLRGTVNPTMCPIGFYCPAGVSQIACPAGYVCDTEGLDAPKPCPNGMRCTATTATPITTGRPSVNTIPQQTGM
jgi:hypothetical protein